MLDFDSFDYFENLLVASVVAVPIFFLLRRDAIRNIFIGTLGVYLLFLVAPRLALFYICYWSLFYVLQHVIRLWPSDRSRWIALTIVVVITLSPMVIWKLWPTPFIIEFNILFDRIVDRGSAWLGAVDRVRDIILPIGLSFATFRAVDLAVKIYLEIVDPLRIDRLYAFGFFPPVQIIGPVIEVTEVKRQLSAVEGAQVRDLLSGLLQIASGLIKIYVFAYVLEAASAVLNPDTSGSTWEYWFELFRYVLYFYFNFSGFSDIAIGVALLFGFHLRPNFNNPYLKTNPQAFWNSWHMSLTRFAQRNVFVPLGGMRARRQYVALIATMMVIALWHDLTIPLVLFGLYHSAGLIIHRIVVSRRPARVGWQYHLMKSTSLYVFVSLSFPLLLLPVDELAGFYGNLI